MGRWTYGDIEHKFWFGLQSSTAADRFGVSFVEREQFREDFESEEEYLSACENPNEVSYYYDKEHLPLVVAELNRIKHKLGRNFEVLKLAIIDKVFGSVSDDSVAKMIGCTDSQDKKYRFMLSEFADYCLGEKIKNSIEEIGQCHFDAEL